MAEKIFFKPITDFKPGIISNLLSKSYKELTDSEDEYKKLIKKWEGDDSDAFGNLGTIGKCFFITCQGELPIGMGSYDPRQGPEYGDIGENCVLPEYRGHGYGKLQIEEILKRFRERKIINARVSTSEHPFFVSAQHTYKSIGFKETRRFKEKPDAKYQMIEYEMKL